MIHEKIKTTITAISRVIIITLALGILAFYLFPETVYSRNERAYSFLPSRIYKMSESIFTWSQKMVEITPTRPIAVTDKEGNTTFVTADGNAVVRIDNQGNKTFSIGGRSAHSRDKEGNLTRRWERTPGSNRVAVKNEFGEVLEEVEYGLGGKTIARYDEKGNLTQSYEYDKYGKNIVSVLDEVTLTRTEYDSSGKPVREVNFEGYEVATYEYDNNDRLKYRESNGHRTFYDEKGLMTRTEDPEGFITNTYNYGKDENGYYYLETVTNEITGDVTLYENGRPSEVRNTSGGVVKDYEWRGTVLVYTEDMESNEITWYKNGRPTFTTFKGTLTTEWFYNDGNLVGTWNPAQGTLTLYSHGREAESIEGIKERPNLNSISALYRERGLSM